MFPLNQINLSGSDQALTRVRLITSIYNLFMPHNTSLEANAYWTPEFLPYRLFGRTNLTGVRVPLSGLFFSSRVFRPLHKRLIDKCYNPHPRYGYYFNRKRHFRRRKKYFLRRRVPHTRISKVKRNFLSKIPRWNSFLRFPDHAPESNIQTILNKEKILQWSEEHGVSTGSLNPWSSVVTKVPKMIFFEEVVDSRSFFSSLWRRHQFGQKIRSFNCRRRSRRHKWWLSRALVEYSPLQQIFRAFDEKERILRHGQLKPVLVRLKPSLNSSFRRWWRRKERQLQRKLKRQRLRLELQRQQLPQKKATPAELRAHKKKIQQERYANPVYKEYKRRRRILNNYYWLSKYRSGYKWRTWSAACASLRFDLLDYETEGLEPFFKRKRRVKTRFKRARKWIPKSLFRYRTRMRRFFRELRFGGFNWLNFRVGKDYIGFNDRRILFKIKTTNSFYNRRHRDRSGLYAPQRSRIKLLAWPRKRDYNKTVTGLTMGFHRITKALKHLHDKPKPWKRATINPKSVKRFSLYSKTRRKGSFKVDQRPTLLSYEEVKDKIWKKRFLLDKSEPSAWSLACYEKGKPYRRSLTQTASLSTKFFNLFLRNGSKHNLEKLVRRFRVTHPNWSPFRVYKKLYTPVGLIMSTRTTIKNGKIKRRRLQVARLTKWQKGITRARKWVVHGVRGRHERQWWSRVVAEIVNLRGAVRFQKRYVRNVIDVARVL